MQAHICITYMIPIYQEFTIKINTKNCASIYMLTLNYQHDIILCSLDYSKNVECIYALLASRSEENKGGKTQFHNCVPALFAAFNFSFASKLAELSQSRAVIPNLDNLSW